MSAFEELETLVEQSDDELKAGLPDVLPEIEGDLETLLLEHPDAYEQLITRMGTLEDPASYVEENKETVETFFDIMWGGLNLITNTIPDVQEAVNQDMSINWECTDTDLVWHMESDADSGIIEGGAGGLDDPALTFSGETDIMMSMIGDDDFNGQAAFMQGEFEIDGSLPMATQLEGMMDSVMQKAQEFEME
ncbi:MAG: SCP2 sterol-binding domain-containing protein [Halobacteria archaeon]|nr:SCP2 sterol-binding domain-containing protein [Halobacteria archaeon]